MCHHQCHLEHMLISMQDGTQQRWHDFTWDLGIPGCCFPLGIELIGDSSSRLRDASTLSDYILCSPCEGWAHEQTLKLWLVLRCCLCLVLHHYAWTFSLPRENISGHQAGQGRIVLLVIMGSCECHWKLVLWDEWQYISSSVSSLGTPQYWQMEMMRKCKVNDARCLIFQWGCDSEIMWKLSE